MAIDWGFAGQVGGMGFAMVFFLLIILALFIWIVGRLLTKPGVPEDKTNDSKKGA
jgi:Na+-transporting methylmalonyl-CoA/oxaloacetate decarboxylase gamma subunit